MKIIFLDVDGVINSGNNMRHNHKLGRTCDDMSFDPGCIRELCRIVRETGAKLVLSSTWRLPDIDTGSTAHIDNLKLRLTEYGLSIFDSTGPDRESRGHEIDSWMREHPDVDEYAILDDADDFYSDNREEHLRHYVSVDEPVGITETDAERAIAILNKTK